MQYTKISHKKLYKGTISDFSSEIDDENSINNILTDNGIWTSKKNNSITRDFFIIDYQEIYPVNFIEITPVDSEDHAFPVDFRIESSIDGQAWKTLQIEKSLNLGEAPNYSIYIPLTLTRFIKMLITRPAKPGSRYYTEIAKFSAGLAGIREITSGSTSSYKNETDKLTDTDNETYWESELSSKKGKEYINIDLGNIFHINRIGLSSTTMEEHGFPENFIINISKDNEIWYPLFDQRNFIAEPSKQYYWDFDPSSCRYIQINMDTVRINKVSYGARIGAIEIFAALPDTTHTHNIGDIVPNASIFQHGIVKLARDGEDTEDAVVRSSDSRLKPASTISRGIVQFAENGQEKSSLAVQSSDSRLKKADESSYGIVKLAKDREDNTEAVIRGSDSRLKNATVAEAGIVRICNDGEYSEFGVVSGNDSRLHHADIANFGIVRLAGNGEESSNCVVQGNDNRLRDATINYKGIVELAENGEDREGVVVQGNDKRLKDATTSAIGIVELAENGEDREGVVVQGNDKRLKDATTSAKGIVELAENGEDKQGVAVQGNDKRLKDATTSAKGIVQLAENGEDREGVAVQGNDKRLKEASTLTKGIVELAENGEDREGVVVQGNDKSLKDASTSAKGIVELAENGEDKEGVVVQGNDKRLKDATTSAKGIVELAENGEDKQGVAVQGNDKRLKDASTSAKGIVQLAENGEDKQGVAVQGNDKRLKDATTSEKGIVELAENGEDREGVAVQGNDKRLKEASTLTKGIVELAEDGEEREGVAVQGNDKRLKTATEDSYGIVRLAKNGENKHNSVVQADDERLFNARQPLEHEHNYAHINHDFNSHKGTIKITDEKEENFNGIAPPSDGSAIIYANNKSRHPGAIGILGISNPQSEKSVHSYGVLGHGMFSGVKGQSSGNTEGGIKGAGVIGISRFGAGGVFSSEHDYSLVVDGFGHISEYDASAQLSGNGEALYVNGKSVFSGQISVNNTSKESIYPVNLAEMFEVDEEQFITIGDILEVSERGKSILTRSTTEYSTRVIGIVSGNPTVIINNSGTEKKIYPVALAGKVLCRIDARARAVKPGDLIVSSETPGCGMAGDIDSFSKTGCVIGKALDSLDSGIGTIPVFVMHI